MTAYLTLFVPLALASAIESMRGAGQLRAALFYSMVVLLVLMIGTRLEIGHDWVSYQRMLAESAHTDLQRAILLNDPGYMLLNWISSRLEFGLLGVNMVCALIFGTAIAKFCWSRPNPILALTVAFPYLILVVGMGYTRQSVAIAMVMLALMAVERNRMFPFFGWIILAATFHKTAIFMLPIGLLSFTQKRIYIYTIGLSIIPVLYLVFIAEHLDRLKYVYIEREQSSDGALIRLLISCSAAAVVLLFSRRILIAGAHYKLWRNIAFACFGLLILLPFFPSSTAIDRMALYLSAIQIMAFSSLPIIFGTSALRNAVALSIAGVYGGILMIWLIYSSYAASWLPYKSYLF